MDLARVWASSIVWNGEPRPRSAFTCSSSCQAAHSFRIWPRWSRPRLPTSMPPPPKLESEGIRKPLVRRRHLMLWAWSEQLLGTPCCTWLLHLGSLTHAQTPDLLPTTPQP